MALQRLQEAGVRLQEYLGHLIDTDGLHPSPSKIRAVMKAPPPTNLTGLRAFLGLVNYYRKFIPNISSELCPLYSLLQKKSKWSWGAQKKRCFQRAKELITSPAVLVHFDPNKEITLSCDASPVGVGAVLAH